MFVSPRLPKRFLQHHAMQHFSATADALSIHVFDVKEHRWRKFINDVRPFPWSVRPVPLLSTNRFSALDHQHWINVSVLSGLRTPEGVAIKRRCLLHARFEVGNIMIFHGHHACSDSLYLLYQIINPGAGKPLPNMPDDTFSRSRVRNNYNCRFCHDSCKSGTR